MSGSGAPLRFDGGLCIKHEKRKGVKKRESIGKDSLKITACEKERMERYSLADRQIFDQ